MNLFQLKNIVLHSGEESDFKIECDALTDKDWECIAYLISKQYSFKEVFGVPTGGLKLEKALKKYRTNTTKILIVDDVLTTGRTMDAFRYDIEEKGYQICDMIGVVLFARNKWDNLYWIDPIFTMWNNIRGKE